MTDLNELIRKRDAPALVAERDALAERVAKGLDYVAQLLAETDRDNPDYQIQKARLEDLEVQLDWLDVALFFVWRETGACVQLMLPKQYPNCATILGELDSTLPKPGIEVLAEGQAPAGTLAWRELQQTENYYVISLSWWEYEHILAPLLTLDQEFPQPAGVRP